MCSFSALTLLVGSFDPKKPVPDMTYNVFGGTLNPVLNQSWSEHGQRVFFESLDLLWYSSRYCVGVSTPPATPYLQKSGWRSAWWFPAVTSKAPYRSNYSSPIRAIHSRRGPLYLRWLNKLPLSRRSHAYRIPRRTLAHLPRWDIVTGHTVPWRRPCSGNSSPDVTTSPVKRPRHAI